MKKIVALTLAVVLSLTAVSFAQEAKTKKSDSCCPYMEGKMAGECEGKQGVKSAESKKKSKSKKVAEPKVAGVKQS
jgi:hypothetical protein